MRGLFVPAAQLRQSFDLAAILAVAGIMVACSVALTAVGVSPVRPSSYATNGLFYLNSLFVIEAVWFLWQLAKVRPDSPLRFAREHAGERWQTIRRGLPMIVLLSLFMPMFSAMKSSIPLFAPFTWDAALIEADRAIFGQDAWLVLQPVLGFPVITSALSLAYHAWVLLIYFGGLYFAVYRRDVGKRYFAAFIALWTIGGMTMAIGFSSVGPCFVGPLLGVDTFDAQMAYLNAVNQRFPVMVLDVQQQLLAWQTLGQHGLGRGITAMPSMHVGLACLFWLATRRVSKPVSWFFLAFLLLIFLGSIHLAYHYAVDGIVAVVLASGLWWASGKLVRCDTAAEDRCQ